MALEEDRAEGGALSLGMAENVPKCPLPPAPAEGDAVLEACTALGEAELDAGALPLVTGVAVTLPLAVAVPLPPPDALGLPVGLLVAIVLPLCEGLALPGAKL